MSDLVIDPARRRPTAHDRKSERTRVQQLIEGETLLLPLSSGYGSTAKD